MKTKLFSLLLAVAVSIGTMFASDTQVNGIWYNFNSTNKTAEVTYHGSSYYTYSNEYAGVVTIPASVTYSGTTYSVTRIGDSAFRDCSGLTSVTIPNSVTSIGGYAFDGCTGLTKVNITDIAAWCNIAFGSSTANPLNFAEHLFVNDVEVTELVIPNSVTSIGDYAFYYCSGLTSVTIPSSVTSIGNRAFLRCRGLTSVTIPSSVTSIGDYAFYDCCGLTSVTIPNNVTSIGGIAFCRVNNIIYSGEATDSPWGAKCVNGYVDGYLVYSDDTKTTLLGCSAAATGEIVIPNSVTSIGQYAFYYCRSLTSVTIPSSVTSIGNNAFFGCNGLISVTCEATAPPTLGGTSVFSNVDKSIPVYVPGESVDLYKAADRWKEFTNILPTEETPAPCILASGTCGAQGDNLIWELSCDSLLTISGTGAMADYSSGSAPWYTYRTTITSIIINNGVSSIGNYAFQNCSGLTSVTIPNSVTSIGNYAFSGCSGLTSVTIPNSVTSIGGSAFYNCSGLTSVTIPNSVTSIGNIAFRGCSGLTKVNITDIVAWCNITFGDMDANPLSCAKHLFVNDVEVTELAIPNSVTSIGDYAFYGCSGLTSVTIPNSVTSIGRSAFYGCSSLTSVTIPNSVTSIGNNAFRDCSGLTSVTIGNSVTSIGVGAFYNCSGLTKVNITDIAAWCNIAFGGSTANPLSYAKHLFVNDVEVTDLVIPNSVTSIGDGTFNGCSSLTSIEIPNSVTSIGGSAFSRCSGLTSVTIPNSVTSIGSSAFSLCSGLTSVTIPNSVTSIGRSAFYGCSSLTSVTIPNSVTSIGGSAFSRCSGLTSVTIPNSVTSIGDYAFRECSGLTSVTIPNSVTSIGGSAFYGCSSLTSVTIPNSVTSIGNRAFENCSSLTDIYVCGDLERFQQLLNNDDRIKVGMPYSITINAEHGNVSYPQTMCDDMLLNATPDYGYHFVKWSDGNTDNPRTFELTCDTTFTAQFVPNQYTLSLQCDGSQGIVEGAGVFDYLAQVQISATPAYGYHFSSWSDGNTANPCTYTVTKDVTLTANFAPNTYSLNVSCNAEQGSVTGRGSYSYLSNRSIEAIPNYGYHFAQWNDGNTNNPRTFVLIKDTTFTAQFAPNQYTLSLQCDGNQGTVEGAGLFDYLAQVQISATPAYGYHFSSWSDGNTANPRTVSITEDKSYTATFAKNTYSITKIANNEQGSVSGPAQGEYLDNISLTATPEYGYRFAQWNDGNTSNPRTFELTRDTTFTAQFVPNQYTLSLQCDDNQGSVEGAGVFDYLTEVQISATPAYGYHFTFWSDGNTANPRTITITKDIALIANFAPNKYSINVSCNAEQGSVKGSGSYTYLSNRTIEATSNYGYHFTQWSDGNTDNPRTIELRQDTTLEAIFAVDKYGTCGDNLQLTWRYDTGSQTLTISGEGDLTTNMRYGVEAVKEMKKLVIEDGVGVIGNEAFANIKTLNTITLGKDVRKLQERVFYNCYNLTAIYNYRKTPASATSNTFEEVDKYACTIYVLAGSEEMFRSATGWKDFYSIRAIGATETTVTDNKVTVEPSNNSVTVTWPVSNEAASYTIDITKDGVVFCRLTFNANGQLTGIAFAPGRDGQSMAPAALMTANGLQFTVTGLTSNTQYGYSITATDAEDTEVASYTGSFTTTGEIATDIDAQQSDIAPLKFIRDNQVLILRGGKTYTIQGIEVK